MLNPLNNKANIKRTLYGALALMLVIMLFALFGTKSKEREIIDAFWEEQRKLKKQQKETIVSSQREVVQEDYDTKEALQEREWQLAEKAVSCVVDSIAKDKRENFMDYVYQSERQTHALCDAGKDVEATAFFKKQLVDVLATNDMADHIYGCVNNYWKQKEANRIRFEAKAEGAPEGVKPAALVKPMPKNICQHRFEFGAFHVFYGRLDL